MSSLIMKKIFQHPPKELEGKKYWRSLEEYSDTPQFREWLEREFPQGAAEMESMASPTSAGNIFLEPRKKIMRSSYNWICKDSRIRSRSDAV